MVLDRAVEEAHTASLTEDSPAWGITRDPTLAREGSFLL